MDFNREFVSQLSSSTDDVPATKRDIKDLMEKHEATQRLVYRLLEEVKVLQNSRFPVQENPKSLSILPRESFLSKEEFMSFEKKIQSSEEYFSNLVKELKKKVSGNRSKFIRSCWRRLMKDDIAQFFCWQGSAAKLPLKSLSITLAIKLAYKEKFSDHSDMEFEKNTIALFQQARDRINKKYTKTSKN